MRSPIIAASMLICLSNLSAASKPNILLIVSEDHGPEIGCYGDPYAQTPNIDRLASEGVCFTNAYVPQSGCSQSRASYLTGLYPHQHGQFGLATWGFRLYNNQTPTLPRLLKKAGYRTGIIGKLHINPASAFPFDFQEITGANFQRKDLSAYANFAETFIDESAQPFFLSINYPDAHDPWIRQVDGIPKHPLNADQVKTMPYMGVDGPAIRELVADYYNCISRLDTLIGELLEVLATSGKADNTIVIYLGDHGADMLRGKRTCYEGGLRIPLMMRWPGHIQPSRTDEFVSTIDLMPTILSALDLPAPNNLPGQALQPLFEDKPRSGTPFREYLFAEYHTHAAAPNYFPQRSVRRGRFKLILSLLSDTEHPDYADTIRKLHGDHERRESNHELNIPQLIANASSDVRTAYETMQRPPSIQLYDLQTDSYEFTNLADSPNHQQIKANLLQELHHWRINTADPLLNPSLLHKLTQEVMSISNKTLARKHIWQYPRYFFDAEQIPSPPSPEK